MVQDAGEMMNQGVNSETAAQPGHNSHEYAHEAHHGQTSFYPPSTSESETVSWTMHRVDNSTENGALSNSTYRHDQQTELLSKNAQEGLDTASLSSYSTTTNAAQDYNSYASYPNSTDPYGYGSAGYPGYYNSYQQQPNQTYSQHPNNAYSQQQPNHAYAQQQPNNAYSQQQQQPNDTFSHQQQPNNTYHQQQQPNSTYSQQQQQSNNTYSQQQQQPNSTYSQQQPSHAQPVGAYQNTGLPYQPISSFQNTGPTSYSGTYYNPGDYQTTGGYPSSSYSNQWNDGRYANYASQQYLNYIPDSSSAYSSGTGASTSLHYQQNYNQYADYCSQTEVSCAPGTENLSVSSTSNQGGPVPCVSGGYPTSNNQPLPPPPPLPMPPPPPLTSSWRPETCSSELPSVQPATPIDGTQDGYWNQGDQSLQNHYATPAQSHFQKPHKTQTNYDSFQVQQESFPQGTNSQYPASHQVSQNYQLPSQALQSLDTRRVSKLQIQTNPRIVSNLPMGSPKVDKEGSTAIAAAKPAYISVSVPKSDDKKASHNSADSILKPSSFPMSLRGYVERALSRCKSDAQAAACKLIMKEIITNATADSTLHTRDWDTEPLFPLPNADLINPDSQISTPVSSLSNYKRSPSRQYKSRWEPLPEEKPVDKSVPFSGDAGKYNTWFAKEIKAFDGNSEGRVGIMNNVKFSLPEQKSGSKFGQRPFKKQKLAAGFNGSNNDGASSDSDKEQSLPSYYSGPISLPNCPEERKRRESRSKRFEKGQGPRAEINHYRPKGAGGGNSYTRRATELGLSKSLEDGGSRAVEDIDWDALTVKGTCQETEKRYLRLTSAPDPATVRPEVVLEKALLMVQNSQKNYLYKCDQLKSIRQDLTVQRIRNHLTVKVYETHARLAIEFGDLFEYNQCQSQLKFLYAEGIAGSHLEFSAYNLLCVILHSNNNRDLVSSMARLSVEAKSDKAVKHALSVRAAVTSGNYVSFFRLYKTAPNLNTCLMNLYVEKMRYKAVSCMSRSYRPMVPVSYIAHALGFSVRATNEESDENDSDGLEECMEWLKAHGACLITDINGEMQLDAKASSSSLYIPEPEDAVAHGDANLAVDDFFTRTSL